MAIDVEQLILQPFRDVVERGKEAAGNAESSGDDEPGVAKAMLKSARTLVREGERALQRLQPLWDERVAQHGDTFVEAMRDNEDILDKQRALEDLLYDLDDFVETDTFDADRFSEVQAASKAFALNLMETMKRLKIEDPAPPTHPPTPVSPEPTWTQPVPKLGPPSIRSLRRNRPSRPPTCALPPTPSTGDGRQRRASSPDILGAERRSVRLVSRPTSTVASPTSPVVPNIPLPSSNPRISAWVNEQTETTSWPANTGGAENGASARHNALVNGSDQSAVRNVTKTTSLALSNESRGRVMSVYTESGYSTADSYMSAPRTSAMIPSSDTRSTSLTQSIMTSHSDPLHKKMPRHSMPVVPAENFETGLMLANESALDVAERRSTRSFTNRLMGSDSSLYRLSGFCAGALKFRTQGHHAATKGAMEYGTSGSVARCVDCEFRHSLAELELDMGRDSSGNWCKADILYRLRFVYKSHMKVKSAHTVTYGCLFCAEQGHTVHEADATVFSREEQLFQHLARHPHPLPEVEGITVLYGKTDADSPLIEDYDLHFPGPPAPSPYPDGAALRLLPAARTIKNHERKYGSRALTDPDGSKEGIIQFFSGSRIVGVEFPEDWKGKWCMGWHEGIRGSFPASLISLEPPEDPPEIGNAGLVATTRWTWDKRDFKDTNAGWLSFGLYETIYNISWTQESDWCWVGMTKKGKVGLFPRTHINPSSMRRESGPSIPVPASGGGGVKASPSLGLMRKLTIQSSGS